MVTYANNWDAGKILAEMTEEQKDRLRRRLAEEKFVSVVLKRKVNKGLLEFVERRLNDERC